MYPFKSIWANLVFSSSLLVLAITGAFFLVVVNRGTETLQEVRDKTAVQVAEELDRNWQRRAEALTDYLAERSSKLIYRLDVEEMREMAAAAASGQGVLYVYIHDAEGRFLVDSTHGANMVGEFPTKPFARSAVASPVGAVHRGSDFLEVAEPVNFGLEKVGTVRVGFSLKGLTASTETITTDIQERIDSGIGATKNRALLLGFLALFTTILAVGLYAHHLSWPLRELAKGTEKIAAGDLTFRARVNAKDEMGELARSFNRMTGDLEQATVSRDYVDNIIKNMMGPLIITSPEGYIKLVNQATLDMLGYEEKVLINLHLGTVFEEKDKKESQRVYERVRAEGLNNAEAFLRARDGRKIPVLLSGSVIRDKNGEPQGIVCVALDITDRKKNEEAIRGYVDRLEHSNHLLKLFTDILSHDLLNPANIITHMSALVVQKDPSRNREEMLMIQRNSRKLTQLIRDASDYARFESGESLSKEKVNLLGMLSSVIERFRPQFAERNMKIIFQPEDEAVLQAHPTIEDVFSNLITNTLKYAPEESDVTVEVRGDDGHWVISVADRGEGIPDEFKEAIFERFERADKKGVKGSGLGLAIARRLVELHGGSIWVEDNPGGGSLFKVRLPQEENA